VSALSATLLQVAETLPTGQRQKLVEALGSSAAPDHEASQRLSLVASAPEFAAQIAQLMTAWREEPAVTGRGLAIALETAGSAVDEGRSREVSVVWTGPAAGVPVRLTRAVVEEVIGAAEERLLVISFAAYRVPVVVDALVAATDRGVQLDLVLETAADSAGKLTFDLLSTFSELANTSIWHWPSARRPELERGAAVLHAKAIVADAKLAFVTSANLTGHAIAYNIELGLLVRAADAAGRIDGYIRGLIERGDLVRVGQLGA